MKTKKAELDVDFIGGQGSLTKEEEQALSEFFRSRKSQRTDLGKSRKKVFTRKKVAA